MTEPHAEYLRRNLITCKAYGAIAGLDVALSRLKAMRRPPKWLVKQLEGCKERTVPTAHEMALWRNAAPDAPGARASE